MATAKIKGGQTKSRGERRRKQKRNQRRCQTCRSADHPKRRKYKPSKKLYYAKSRFSMKRLTKLLNNIEARQMGKLINHHSINGCQIQFC